MIMGREGIMIMIMGQVGCQERHSKGPRGVPARSGGRGVCLHVVGVEG